MEANLSSGANTSEVTVLTEEVLKQEDDIDVEMDNSGELIIDLGCDNSSVEGMVLTKEEPSEQVLKVAAKSCCVCKNDPASLRCPQCLLKYCNLSCYREHKSQNICKVSNTPVDQHKDTSNSTGRQYFYPTQDTLPIKSLEKLSSGANLKPLKKHLADTKLRQTIRHLNRAQNPIEEFRKIMLDENFVQFSDFILSVLRDNKHL